MLKCDICNKQITSRRDIFKQISLPYEYSCKAYQNKNFDVCSECQIALNNILVETKLEFVQTNGLMLNDNSKNKREARWKGAGLGDYSCSLCCETYSGGDSFNYCPNCGAKMYDNKTK